MRARPSEIHRPVFLHHDGALGDVLLSLSCIDRIGAACGSLHFAGRGDIGMLLRVSGVVAEASSTAEARYAMLQGGSMSDALRAFLGRFGRAILFTVDPESLLVRSVAGVIPDTQVIVTIPPHGSTVPVARFRQDQLRGGAEIAPWPLLPVPLLHRELAAGMLSRAGHDGFRPIVAVHPGSGGRAKNWPLERFFQLIVRCKEQFDPFIILLSGPAEETMQDRIDAFSRQHDSVVHFAGADLAAVAALLQASDLYLGNDSGVSHLAAAVGCRTVVLFGPTDPVLWAPPAGKAVEVIGAADLADITVGAVYERIIAILGACREGACPQAGHDHGKTEA